MTTWRLESMWTRTLSTTISTNASSIVAGLSHGRRVRPADRRIPRVGPASAGHGAHEQPDGGPEDEAADVREERDLDIDRAERGQAVDELQDEPEGQDDERRHVDELVEEAQEHERGDARPRV